MLYRISNLILIGALYLLISAGGISGRTFVVNSGADRPDLSPGDGVCNSSLSDTTECTLRAALDEANALFGADTILFINQTITVRLTLGPLVLTDDKTVILGNGPSTRIDGVSNQFRENTFEIQSDSNQISGLQIERSRRDAVRITGAFNLIGGDSLTERVILVGNGLDDSLAAAVRITGPEAKFNHVGGNHIGIADNGIDARGNQNGVAIENNASENVVGGSFGQNGNLVSGNFGYGIIFTSGAFNNRLHGGLIGLDITGETSAGNRLGGIMLSTGAHDNLIGGDGPGEMNLISGNEGDGIVIRGAATTGNKIIGNRIGPDLSGLLSKGNIGAGIRISEGASGNIIGQSGESGGNVISGNFGDGVILSGEDVADNILLNNLIGAEQRGFGPLPNGIDSGNGVSIVGGAHDNVIGGDSLSKGNLISGNIHFGLLISGGSSANNIVIGNFIGVNISGSSSLINGSGIVIRDGAHHNRIGGVTTGERNIISGNRGDVFPFGAGVAILDPGSNNNVIIGNYIGADLTGTRALRNGSAGVMIAAGASANQIGGSGAGEGNLISGNGSGPAANSRAGGVHITGGLTSDNLVIGNQIGVTTSGTKALSNRGVGVGIYDGASGNDIGGETKEDGNLIAFSNGHGVLIDGVGTDGNLIRYNVIKENDSLGIALRNGAQNSITPPLIISATNGQVSGMGAPPLGRVDIYIAAGDPSGEGEGIELIASGIANGSGSFSINNSHIADNDSLTAISTDVNGNSSAFATNVMVGVITGIDDSDSSLLPLSVRLAQNYPNPFNPSTTIEFELPKATELKLSIYNLLGQEVQILFEGPRQAGAHRLVWDGRDSRGNPVSSGLYFYRLSGDGINLTRKMSLLK